MGSELALDAAVRACGPLAAFPASWAEFAAAGGLGSLVSLAASHENADIAAGVLGVLQALTDEEAGDAGDGAAGLARPALVAALRAAHAAPAIARRLVAFDEGVAEEAGAVGDGLATLQAMVEVDGSAAGDLAGGAGPTPAAASPFLPWLLARVRLGTPGKPGARGYDAVAGAASELLVVLAQAPVAAVPEDGGSAAAPPAPPRTPPAAGALLAAGGVDALLQALASYRGRDPADADESEHLENLGDALCALLVAGGGGGASGRGEGSAAQAAFVEAEGVELAVLLLRKKGAAAPVAVKALDFALPGCPAAAERLVAAGGLGPVFAAFMGTAKAALGGGGGGGGAGGGAAPSRSEASAAEARAVGVVSHLLQTLPPSSPARARLASKFTEAGGAKCERAVDLFARWWDGKVGGKEASLQARAAAAGAALDPALLARARLDAGLFTAHQLALVLGHAWSLQGEEGGFEARRAIVAALHDRGGSLGRVRAALRDYRSELGDGGGDPAAAAVAAGERARVDGMLAAMGEGGVLVGRQAAPAVAPAAAPPPPPPHARPRSPVREGRPAGEEEQGRGRHRSRSPRGDHHRATARSRSPRGRQSHDRDRRDSGRRRTRSRSPRRDSQEYRRRSRSRSPRRRRS